jgi:hypothetical protein
MMNIDEEAMSFNDLEPADKDLTMFTITDVRIMKKKDQVHMMISLKRKIQTELLTTYLPTLLLLMTTYATTFFKEEYFEASVMVNLTIMLVMTTIFTSKIMELPPTSDTKMIDIWLIFSLLIPFAFTLVQTAIECYREEDKEDPNEKWAVARNDDGREPETKLVVAEVEICGEEVAKDKNEISVDMIRTLRWAGWSGYR